MAGHLSQQVQWSLHGDECYIKCLAALLGSQVSSGSSIWKTCLILPLDLNAVVYDSLPLHGRQMYQHPDVHLGCSLIGLSSHTSDAVR